MARVTQGLWPRLRILVFTPRAAEFELVSFLSPTSLGAPPALIFCSFTLSLQSPCPGEGFSEGRMDGQTHGPRKGQPEPDSTPIFLPAIPIKFSEKQQASHHLYVREHRVRGGTKSSWPQKRTLFVLNVPPYCTEECLSRLLSPCGAVQSVQLQEKPDLAESPQEPKSKFFDPKPVPGFRVAYVAFQKPGGLAAALALKGPLLVSTESHPVKSGVHKWIRDYTDSVPDPEALRVDVDTFMETYDKKMAEEEAKAKEKPLLAVEQPWKQRG